MVLVSILWNEKTKGTQTLPEESVSGHLFDVYGQYAYGK